MFDRHQAFEAPRKLLACLLPALSYWDRHQRLLTLQVRGLPRQSSISS